MSDRPVSAPHFDDCDAEVRAFRLQADAFVKRHTVSPQAAAACLVSLGIHNPDGTLAAPYDDKEDQDTMDTRPQSDERLLLLADAMCEAACEISNQMEEAEPWPLPSGRSVFFGRSPVWAYTRLSKALNAYYEVRHDDGTSLPPGVETRLPRQGTHEDEIVALRDMLHGVIGLLDAEAGKQCLDGCLPGARALLEPLAPIQPAAAPAKSPVDMTVAELQAEIAPLQMLLHFKVAGDPRVGVSVHMHPPGTYVVPGNDVSDGPARIE